MKQYQNEVAVSLAIGDQSHKTIRFRVLVFTLLAASILFWNVAVVNAQSAPANNSQPNQLQFSLIQPQGELLATTSTTTAPPLPALAPRIGPDKAQVLPVLATNTTATGLTGYATGRSEIGIGSEILSNPDGMDVRSTRIDISFVTLSEDFVLPDISYNERWIRVDVGNQQVVAYEGQKPIRAFIVSTGLPNFPTVTGEFRIRMKVSQQTMSGDGYNLPGVKWVQYFYQEYAFHGTYWHDDFGIPKSHGCVNMTNADSQWLFNWAGPVWDEQTVWFQSSEDNPGTLVVVHQ